MEFNQYNTTVQQWIHTVLENRETNADVVLECCRDIIAYGRETDDPKLMGFGFFYGGEIYYELNDGAHFFHMMTEALTYLDRAEEWELVVRCYNFLGIASMSRGNPSLALDYYMNGLKDSDTYDLPMQKDYDSDQYGVIVSGVWALCRFREFFFRSLSDFADKTEG